MEHDITSIQQRVQQLRTNYAIKQSKRQEEALAARRSLDRITQEDEDMLKAIVPELATIRKFTAKQIQENANGEVELIRAVRERLIQFVEQRLSYYEEQL